MLNEKGFTLVEVLIASVIIISIMTVAFQFFESYNYGEKGFGEYITAKSLAVKTLEEQKDYFVRVNDINSSVVFNEIKKVNGTNFEVKVTKNDETDLVSVLNDERKLIKLTSVVKWRKTKVEVSSYVSER